MKKEERIEIAEKICATYGAENVTLESATVAHGMPVRTFNDWCNNNAEIAELYKKAKQAKREARRIKLKYMALTALERLISVTEVTEVHTEGKLDADGKTIVTKQKNVKKVLEPNPVAVIFTLKNTDPDNWTEKQQIDHNLREMNMDKIELIVKTREEDKT